MKIFALISVALLLLVVGCGQGEKAQSDTATKDTTEATSHEGHDHATKSDNNAYDAKVAATTVSGTLGCGHCNYSVGEGCSAALKTADGKIYILDGVAHDAEAFTERMSQPEIKVTGVLAEGDPGHIAVQSYEL